MLSAKAIEDRDPADQRIPPASRDTKPIDDLTSNMRHVTSSSVLLPGSVLMLQKNDSDPGKWRNVFLSFVEHMSQDKRKKAKKVSSFFNVHDYFCPL